MRKYIALLLFMLLIPEMLFISRIPAISSAGAVETKYDVVTKGFRVGNILTLQRSVDEGGINTVHFENRTAVNASFLWFHYNLMTSERAVIKGENLVSYSFHKKAKGEDVTAEGRLDGDTFRFNVNENGKKRTIAIRRSSYDHTTMECPEATMDFGATGKMVLKMLDTEFMTVVERRYRLVREEIYRVGDKEYHCRIVDFTDPNKSCRRWIGKDGDAVIMFRQDGKNRDGSYSVRATELNRTGRDRLP
jgi:hypothetical protein